MTLSSVRAGDIVEVDVRGFRFLAKVRAKDRDGLDITPLPKNVSCQRATARQVTEHWSKRRRRATAPAEAAAA